MSRGAWVRRYTAGGSASPPAVSGIDPPFWPKLVSYARGVGADPRDWAAVMLLESGLAPAIANRNASGAIVAVGLNQFSTVGKGGIIGAAGNTFAALVPSMTPAEYLTLPASAQLDFVAKYFGAEYERFPTLAREGAVALQWVNFLPVTFVANASDDHEITRDPGAIAGNPIFLLPGDPGVIRRAGLEQGLRAAQKSNAPRWAAVLANIDAAELEAPPGAVVFHSSSSSSSPGFAVGPAFFGLGLVGLAIVAARARRAPTRRI